MEQSPSWEGNSCTAGQEIHSFIEPEVSLPRAQEPATNLYP
jgi:hypothetical protein